MISRKKWSISLEGYDVDYVSLIIYYGKNVSTFSFRMLHSTTFSASIYTLTAITDEYSIFCLIWFFRVLGLVQEAKNISAMKLLLLTRPRSSSEKLALLKVQPRSSGGPRERRTKSSCNIWQLKHLLSMWHSTIYEYTVFFSRLR